MTKTGWYSGDQKQAAEIAMCALSTYQKWEAVGKGNRNPPAAKIALLKIWIKANG